MSPAKELAKLEPLIGNWAGRGMMVEPGGGKTKWTASTTNQWCLNKHFVQQDFVLHFDGIEEPVMFRTYLGWDREGKRYVATAATNDGMVRLDELNILGDGTMLRFLRHIRGGIPYTERARTKVTGDTMSLVVDLLLHDGDSSTIIDGKLKRSDESCEVDWGESAFMGTKPNDEMKKVAVFRGKYETKGEMVMIPGTDPLKITGSDTFAMVWEGNVMHGRTEGFAEGSTDAYEAHSFWGWDAQAKCIRAISVNNMGEVTQMDVRWVGDQLVSTSSGTMGGMPMTQRYVITFGRKGELKGGVGHTVVGAMEPFLSFTAHYKKRG